MKPERDRRAAVKFALIESNRHSLLVVHMKNSCLTLFVSFCVHSFDRSYVCVCVSEHKPCRFNIKKQFRKSLADKSLSSNLQI